MRIILKCHLLTDQRGCLLLSVKRFPQQFSHVSNNDWFTTITAIGLTIEMWLEFCGILSMKNDSQLLTIFIHYYIIRTLLLVMAMERSVVG